MQTAKRPIERLRHPGAATHSSDVLWALRDIDIELRPGQALGVVGRNGAGKSTLLKVLSHITEPTEGRVELRGRVASLLEVGTGFHPELTGRENIQLNGAILGMTRNEIKRRFDEIVDFSEVGRFLDTPVKRYSSGMYVRLAFSVAAHLEPDILIIDEVLAVGDASFQQKCLGKMEDEAGHGRTVLFVSHNLNAVRSLCSHSVLLDGGRVVTSGNTEDVLQTYLARGVLSSGKNTWSCREEAPSGECVWLRGVQVVQDEAVQGLIEIDKPLRIDIDLHNDVPGSRLDVALSLHDYLGTTVFVTGNAPQGNLGTSEWYDQPHPVGDFRYSCTVPGNFLNDGRYDVTVWARRTTHGREEFRLEDAVAFDVVETGRMLPAGFTGKWAGVVRVPLEWRSVMLPPEELLTGSSGDGPTGGAQ